MNWVMSLLIGVLFGAVLQRVQASSPDRIVRMLTLRDTTIFKFMLLAIGVGAVGVGVLTALGHAHVSIKPLPVLGVVFGGLIFGIGFALGGYCPGTCLVGAAEGRRDAWFTVAGGLTGAWVYSWFHPLATELFLSRLNLGQPTLASVSGGAASTVGILFGVGVTVAALLIPRHLRKERAT